MKSLSLEYPLKGENIIIPWDNARKPLAVTTHLFRTRAALLADSVLCVVNVGNLLPMAVNSIIMRDFTLEEGLMIAMNKGNPLPEALPSVIIREFTLDKGFMPAVNVGNLFSHTYNLHYQERVHTAQRSFECHECGKSFTSSHGLHCHQRIHTKSS